MLKNRSQVQPHAIPARRQQERKLRRDRIDGLVAFLRRLVIRAGERSYLVLKPTVEERAWRKDVRPHETRSAPRPCSAMIENWG